MNPLLGAPSEDAFVALLLAGLGSYPPYFARLREVNRRGPAVYGPEPPALAQLDPGQVRSLADDGAVVVTCARSPTTRRATSPARCRSRCGTSSPPGWAGWSRPAGPSS